MAAARVAAAGTTGALTDEPINPIVRGPVRARTTWAKQSTPSLHGFVLHS